MLRTQRGGRRWRVGGLVLTAAIVVGLAGAGAAFAGWCPPATADLAVTKSGPASVSGGGQITYAVTVKNLGAAPATHVGVKDVLPAGVTLVSATPSQGTCTGATCALGSLAKSASATVTIVVGAPCAAATLTDTASAWADQKDPNPGNSSASASTAVTVPCVGVDATLSNGGRVTTDPTGAGPAPASGVFQTAGIVAPTGVSGAVSIDLSVQGPAASCPSVHQLVATTDQPAAGPGQRLELNFTYAACSLGGLKAKDLHPRKSTDGVNFVDIPRCKDDYHNAKNPDPCYQQPKNCRGGDVQITVLWSGMGDPRWTV